MFYIEKLKVNWYGPLAFEGEADFLPGVNIIMGKNGSGKTLTLQMIKRAADNSADQIKQDEVDKVEDENLVKITTKSSEKDVDTITFNKAGQWQNIQIIANKIRFITSDRVIKSGASEPNPLHRIPKPSLPHPEVEINISNEFNKAIFSELIQKIKLLEEAAPNITKEIEEAYRRGLVDFEKDIRVDFVTRENPVYFIDYKGRELQVDDLSSGEKEYLYFYSFLRMVKDYEGNIILIDEPELHLHGNQIRKLCELIEKTSENNQIIIATHSGEILQHFLGKANTILFNKGKIENIKAGRDLRKIVEEIGMPIDPSFFTAHWICAENNPDLPLAGPNAPTTEDVLSWVFERDITKRFWAFGSSKIRAEAVGEILQSASTSLDSIKLSIIIDGDKLVIVPDNFPPQSEIAGEENIFHWPMWEIENLFLLPALLERIIPVRDGKSRPDLFWSEIEKNKERLFISVLKSVIKNNVRTLWRDNYFRSNKPMEDLDNWQELAAKIEFDDSQLRVNFDKIIADRNWKWLPGKEVLPIVFNLVPDFWSEIRKLVDEGEFSKLLKESDPEIATFINGVVGVSETEKTE